MKYLVVGLGNIGIEYKNTRHNIGFEILDAFVEAFGISFSTGRYGDLAYAKHKGRQIVLLKPSTYMNLSGKAVNYWLAKEKIPRENLLIITDDLALPVGKTRLRKKGSDGGHNGLKNIIEILNTTQFNRLRVGIGNDFNQGRQVDFVLGSWEKDEEDAIKPVIKKSIDVIKSFVTIGVDRTMNFYN